MLCHRQEQARNGGQRDADVPRDKGRPGPFGSAGQELAPPAQKLLQQWREGGIDAHGAAVAGEAFWQTPETATVPALLEQTWHALEA